MKQQVGFIGGLFKDNIGPSY